MPALATRIAPDGESMSQPNETTPDEIAAAVARGREASAHWSALGIHGRLVVLREVRRSLLADMDGAVEALAAATGKPHLDALTSEVYPVVETLSYLEEHAAEVLAPQRRAGHVLSQGSDFEVWYEPFGVVAVFSPWNYPLQLSAVPALTALAAGNAVILKPSEVTPSLGDYLAELLDRAGLPSDVFQVLHGGPAVGAELVRAAPDRIFFTGSVNTGKAVMRSDQVTL